jgi:hypothetical protein
MTDRFCANGCGKLLGAMQRANSQCRVCKERDLQTSRDTKRKQRDKQANLAGAILLHSCLSNGVLDPFDPTRCLCRKYVSVDHAKHLVKIGRVVDWQTRKEFFNNGPVVEKSRLRNPPMSSLGQKVAIERKVEFDERDIVKMRATVLEDRTLRDLERSCKIEVEHELSLQTQASLIVFVDPELFDEAKKRSWGRPEIFVTKDERSSTGRDVGPAHDEQDEEDQNDQTITTETNADENTESATTEDTESVEDLAEVEFENSDLAEAA